MIRLLQALVMTITSLAATAGHGEPAPYDGAAMQAARQQMYATHGAGTTAMLLAERFEYRTGDGEPFASFEGQGWWGSDLHKLWFKADGEYELDQHSLEEFELQALYSRAVHPFWDLQAGVRHDFEPDPSRTYLVLGLNGMAPYWFELDGNLFLSERGDLSLRLEAEYELRLTQRWILQPRVELDVAFTDDEAIGVGSGLSSIEAGLRLRYEIRRELAPYFGVAWQRKFGDSADFDPHDRGGVASVVAGVRFWF